MQYGTWDVVDTHPGFSQPGHGFNCSFLLTSSPVIRGSAVSACDAAIAGASVATSMAAAAKAGRVILTPCKCRYARFDGYAEDDMYGFDVGVGWERERMVAQPYRLWRT